MLSLAIKAMLQGSMGAFFNDDKIIHKIRQAYDFVSNFNILECAEYHQFLIHIQIND
jgi:uncharacterized membrane protein YsdA (DUF1294 family)